MLTEVSSTVPRSATLKDVAALAGVDKGSVSVVLNGAKSNTGVSLATRERIMRAASELNYQPNALAQRLATGLQSKHIDIFALMLDAGIGVGKIKRIQNLLMDAGYDVPVHSYDFYTNSQEEAGRKLELIRALRRQRPRAIVCATPGVNAEVLAEIEGFIAEGGCVVCYDDEVPIACDNVVFDTEANLYLATAHLLELGHRRIGLYLQGNLEPFGPIRTGFERALQEVGLEVNPHWLFGTSNAAEIGGAELAQQFLALSERPTAMCIINDHSAFAFMVELERHGVQVPQDVSVIGHDDAPVARFCPAPLTTVSHPAQSIAESVVELLVSRLNGDLSTPPRKVIVRGELIVRSSAETPVSP